MKIATLKRKSRERILEIYAEYCTGKYTLKELGEKYGIAESRASVLISEAIKLSKTKKK